MLNHIEYYHVWPLWGFRGRCFAVPHFFLYRYRRLPTAWKAAMLTTIPPMPTTASNIAQHFEPKFTFIHHLLTSN